MIHGGKAGLILLFGFCFSPLFLLAGGKGVRLDTVRNATQLEALIALQRDSINIVLAPGDYHLHPKKDIDTSIEGAYGEVVPFTYGLKIKSKIVVIRGAKAYSSIIYTHSGYGLLFDGCTKASIEGVVVTAGIRDSDSRATDAGIVGMNCKLDIIDDIIFENLGDTAVISKTKVGVMGICAREGCRLFAYNNQVARNSWSGIGVYKGATATITGNLIDGVDDYSKKNTGGRGTGIIITRNGKATVETNVVKRYWSGIGVFVNAQAMVSENLIEDIHTWGICIWDADTGKPVARIESNVIYKTGACGAAIKRYKEGSEPGFFTNNIIVESAQNREYDNPDLFCYQCALAVEGKPDKFLVEGNVFYKNTWLSPCNTNLDLGIAEFATVLRDRYSTMPLRWYAGYSEFIQRFYFYSGQKPQ